MRSITMAAALAISLYLILGLVGASEYQFGTKVLADDKDIGRPLFAMPPGTDIQYWDTGVIPGYDDTDVVYLSVSNIPPASPAYLKANDVRLTPFGNLPAGSKITPSDNDIGMPILPISPFRAIRYLDLFGGPTCDLSDPVYISQNTPFTIVNDVRLNTTHGTGLESGTKVGNFEPDLNKMLGFTPGINLAVVPLPAVGPFSTRLGFFDVIENSIFYI
jgi:hypothetical protein